MSGDVLRKWVERGQRQTWHIHADDLNAFLSSQGIPLDKIRDGDVRLESPGVISCGITLQSGFGLRVVWEQWDLEQVDRGGK